MKAMYLSNGEVVKMTDNFRSCPTAKIEQIEVIFQDNSKGWVYTADLEYYVDIDVLPFSTQDNATASVCAVNEGHAESILDSYLEDTKYSREGLNYVDEEKGIYYFNIVTE